MQSDFGVTHQQIIATCVGNRACRAVQGNWLSILQSGDPDHTPSGDHLVSDTASIGHETLTLAKGKLVAATEMEDIANIEGCQPVVALDAEARNARSAIPLQATSIQ